MTASGRSKRSRATVNFPMQTGRARTAKRESQPDGSIDSVLAFMRLLWAVDHGMRSVSTSMRSRLGVTGPERLILRMVGRSQGIAAGDVARLLHKHASSITAALQRLVRRGLLVSRIDPADRRKVILHLTAAGQQIDGLSSGTVEAAMRRALSDVSLEDIRAAEHVLEVIAKELSRGRRSNGARK